MAERVDQSGVALDVAEAPAEDTGRAFARIDPDVMAAIGVSPGDIVELIGDRSALARAMPTRSDDRGTGRVRLDAAGRQNAQTAPGNTITVRPIASAEATQIKVASPSSDPLDPADVSWIAGRIDGVPARTGDLLLIPLYDGRLAHVIVRATVPSGATVIGPATVLDVDKPPRAPQSGGRARAPTLPADVRGMRYDHVGGLGRELSRLREMVELPLLRPDVFDRLGIRPPRGVLLHGPPGTGKTLLARAVAAETHAAFVSLDAPSVMQKHYGESEAKLREVFEKAGAAAPAIIFIDEIDAIASKRDSGVGEVEKRVVAQLLALMDGLGDRGQVVVIAATNLPNNLDPALRRPGRFDREIAIRIPDQAGRGEILGVHTRAMPLGPDVDLDALAADTHGFTGADLGSLCREAGMNALRRAMADLPDGASPPADISVLEADFHAALAEVVPSGLREVKIEFPETRWRDVGGLDSVRSKLTEWLVWPRHRPELFATLKLKAPRGVVLHGPPGTGKTLLARTLASEAGVNFIAVLGPELLSRYVGDSERAVREVFETARRASPCLLFFDEIDSIAPVRGASAGSDVPDRVVAQLLVEIDGVRPLGDVMLLAATNRVDRVDPALLRPGRFDYKLAIDLPSAAERLEILRIAAAGRPADPALDLDAVAVETEGRSGADLRSICDAAALHAARRTVETGAPPAVKPEDFERALDEANALLGNAP